VGQPLSSLRKLCLYGSYHGCSSDAAAETERRLLACLTARLLESGSRARPEYRAANRNFIGGPAGLLPRSDQGNPLLLGTPQRTSAIS
jgi:hypothetical protein